MQRIFVPISAVMMAAAVGFVVGVPAVHAGAKPCIREAKRDYKDCTTDCKEAFQTAKDACLDRDHACVEVCRADRSQCRLDTGFDALIDACNDGLEQRRAMCVMNNPPGELRDQCIDDAQVDAFQCRDAARELAKPLLKACRNAFRTCAQACGPAVPPNPADRVQCLIDAKNALKDCGAACKEEFQFDKDVCRGRDHACVEQCRAVRTTCRQLVSDQLAADIAACQSAKQQGIQDDCNVQYPPPRDPDQEVLWDHCVDGYQVQAFICRDNAKEAAHPGFEACRQQFRTCVQMNCPPVP